MFVKEYNEFCVWYNKRDKPFRTIKFIFNYKSSDHDKLFLDTMLQRWKELSEHVNKWAANSTTNRRSNDILLINAVAWLIAERMWIKTLNDKWIKAVSTPFTEAKNQIDIEILPNHSTIEVRSSFPRNWISFAICHPKYQFDVLWPYSNNYKPWEIDKDFYVRTLFPFDVNEFLNRIKNDNFEAYVVWWATLNMMRNIWVEKDLIPDWWIIPAERAKYLTIPIWSALDVYWIINEMKKEN